MGHNLRVSLSLTLVWQSLANIAKAYPAVADILKPFLTTELRPPMRHAGSHRYGLG